MKCNEMAIYQPDTRLDMTLKTQWQMMKKNMKVKVLPAVVHMRYTEAPLDRGTDKK